MHATPYLTRRVFLTLLSPVHVGCGETYEPTNYVIDRGVLYGFDSIPVKLNAQELSELQRLGSKGDWVELASFFHRNRQRFMPYARTSVPIGSTVRGKQIKQIEKKLPRPRPIERTAYVPVGEDDQAYVPGSSVKGAVHTALLERLQSRAARGALTDEQLWGQAFESRPLRRLKVGDFMPVEPVRKRVMECKRCSKKTREDIFPTAVEMLWPGNCRAFSSSWLLDIGQTTAGLSDAYRDYRQIAADLNAFYRPKLEWELKLLENEAGARDWVRRMRGLLVALDPKLKCGDTALVRVGRYQGALTLRLSTSFKDPLYSGRDFKDPPSTQIFVADDDLLLPFGWALLEFDGETSAALEAWCRSWPACDGGNLESLRRIRREEDARRRAQEQAENERREEARAAEAAEAQRLEAMSDEERRVTTLGTKLSKYAGNVNPGTELFLAVQALLREAETWPKRADRQFCARTLAPLVKARGMYQGKAKKELKERLASLLAEE